ncbi:GDSL-type esterase/lipase family protein [Actinomyces sp. oral taxon 448]|uniref:GDSL-type esterase/lipase family protein n=3 Tax=Actinomyces TaxID=1654 RepID=UPI000218A2F4|nr:GDSL-type esterase/lipase family protein [Actinomyces sp. oral taxon 448]EGQ73119.1 GDSL family lipase [Actinomyces sp. oral taxon 448 str. F0400]
MDETRIHFIGDELVAGYGDPRALGWAGRVMARTPRDLDAFWATLAVPRETTVQLADRWPSEVALRSTHTGLNRLVIGLGTADVGSGISPARSRLALANILDKAASEQRACFVVGPPPLPGVNPDGTAALSRAVTEVCHRRGVPYVETFEPLHNHEQWMTDVAAGDGNHPGQAGYGLLAWLVLHRGWYEWLGVEQPG